MPVSPRPGLRFPTLPEAARRIEASSPPDFQSALDSIPYAFSPRVLQRLQGFIQLVSAATELMNLTAVRDVRGMWMTLVFDALTLAPYLADLSDGASGVDVGCGSGIPGIPLAIALPHLRFELVDATSKKIAFVRHVVTELGLGNVQATCGRAESLAASSASPSRRECYDFVLARAVAPLPVLLELVVAFARAPDSGGRGAGRILIVKGERADEELAAAARAMEALNVSLAGRERSSTGQILSFKKHASTPGLFPRANGVPKRSPL